MTTPLEAAIADQQFAVNSYKPGTKDQPKEGSQGWYALRAAVIGLGWLKRLQQLDLADSPEAANLTYRAALVSTKSLELDIAAELVAEAQPMLLAP